MKVGFLQSWNGLKIPSWYDDDIFFIKGYTYTHLYSVSLIILNGLQKALVKRLYSLFTIKDSAAHVPRNLEARRRLQFFTNSLFMDVPPPKSVDKMLSFRYFFLSPYFHHFIKTSFSQAYYLPLNCIFSVFTPYYSEVVLYSMAELTKRNEDGISILFYLQKIYPGVTFA